MAYKCLLILLSEIAVVIAAPLVFLPQSIIPDSEVSVLQEQLQELQSPAHGLFAPSINIPMIVPASFFRIPSKYFNFGPEKSNNNDQSNENTNKNKEESNIKGESIENEDSVVIEAKPEIKPLKGHRIMYLLPNGQRFSVGSIISAIPFLPFEINVPDSIGWVWNGISGIISGLGQRWPFRPRPQDTPQPISEPTLKLLRQQQQELEQMILPSVPDMPSMVMPIVLIPLG